MRDADTPAVFRYGRLVHWLVLGLLGLSMLYSLWIVMSNWTAVTV
jgi:hypothetical protein